MYYFVTVVFLLLSANATFLPFFNIDWFIVEFVFIWIGLELNRFTKKDIRLFVNFALIYLSFCVFRSIFLTHLPIDYFISDVVYLFKFIFPSFLFCAVLKDKATYYLSKVIADSAIISICFFVVQLVAGNMLYSIGSALAIPPLPHEAGYEYTNFIVFNFVKQHAFQNSGFSWEPGAFGFFLNIGLVLHFFNNNFKLDKRALWIIFAIVTTVSTTSYIALIIVFLLYFRARGIKFNRILLFAVPIICVMIFELPFLADKIVQTYKEDMYNIQNINELSAYYVQINQAFALNRFASLIFIYDLFGAKLIFGVSNIYTEIFPILKNINISNGIFEFCAKFGAIGLVFLLYRAYLYFRSFTYSFEQAIYCIILLLILGFGESIFIIPITMAFYFLYHYAQPEEIIETDTDEEEIGELA